MKLGNPEIGEAGHTLASRLLMKLTGRQKEIVLALADGARLRHYYGECWRLEDAHNRPRPMKGGTIQNPRHYVMYRTMQKMKRLGILQRVLTGSGYDYEPTEEALLCASKRIKP